METIARLKELMKKRGISLYRLAMLCHIPYSTLKNALKKDTELSNLTIAKICQSLGIPFYQFFMSEKDWADLGAEIREKAWAKQDQRGNSQPCTPS